MKKSAMRYAFLVLFSALAVILGVIAWPFVPAAFLAMTLAIICMPLQHRLNRIFHRHRYLAAGATTVIIGLCVVFPLAVLAAVAISQAGEFVQSIATKLQEGTFTETVRQVALFIQATVDRLTGAAPGVGDIQRSLVRAVEIAANRLYEFSPRVVTTSFSAVVNFFLMFLFLAVFLVEGPRLRGWLEDSMPLEKTHWREITRNMRHAITTSLGALLLIGLAQGILLGGAFLAAGFENALGWALVAAIICVIPIVGAASCYLASTAVLFATGRPLAAVIFLAYGVGVVSNVDVLIRSFVIRGASRIHPLLLFVALIGSTLLMGPIGIVAGPVLLVIFLSMLRIYRREFVRT